MYEIWQTVLVFETSLHPALYYTLAVGAFVLFLSHMGQQMLGDFGPTGALILLITIITLSAAGVTGLLTGSVIANLLVLVTGALISRRI